MDAQLEDYLSSLRGAYGQGYFYIYLSGRYEWDLSKLSKTDLGTFFHEYVHFLQNISTLWGIKVGIMRNNVLCSLFNATNAAKIIHIPFDFQLDLYTKLEVEYQNQAQGCTGRDSSKIWMIDASKEIHVFVDDNPSQKWPIPLRKVFLNVTFQDGRTEKIQLGSTIVVESMAALCQSLIDPEAQHEDVPYNLVQILANQKFPHIASDTKKLISLCYLSLFSLDPGWSLLDQMVYAEHSDLSGYELFNKFINETNLRVNGRREGVVEFFDSIIDGYKQSIKGLIGVDVDYLSVLLDRVRLSRNQAPLISILSDSKPIGVEHIQALVNYLSIPFIYSADQRFFYPASTQSPQGSGDVALMVCAFKLFDFLVHPKRGCETICPFVAMCSADHDNCYSAPWMETNCTMEPAMKKIGVYGKPVVIDVK